MPWFRPSSEVSPFGRPLPLKERRYCGRMTVSARILLVFGHGRFSPTEGSAHELRLVQYYEQLKKFDGLLLSPDSSTRDVRRGVEGDGEGRHVVQNRRIVSSCSSLDPVGRDRNL